MKKLKKGRKFSRTSDQRKALLNNLASSLFINKRIVTTLTKAKELRPFSEKLITRAKEKDLNNIRYILKFISNKASIELFDKISKKAEKRKGGYIRIIKTPVRQSDRSSMAIVELVDFEKNFDDFGKTGKNQGKSKANDKLEKKNAKKSAQSKREKQAKAKKKKPEKSQSVNKSKS